MHADSYPDGTVRALLSSDAVTPVTRRVLLERLAAQPLSPQFFDAETFGLLKAICARLVPQVGNGPVDLAGGIDQRLAGGRTDGWRYNAMPPDGEAYRMGLRGIEESAKAQFNLSFQQATDAEKDSILQRVQAGSAPGDTWKLLPSDRFFEEMLAEAAELYCSHPLVQEEMGYVGMADAPGWSRIGLNEREEREPLEKNEQKDG
ncbi:MAG: gluconate 2-dehydrogenase subunit 3 family protein [Ferruginibacter sp.]|nr:gluconate 2-dehydrogenase subunit 3 family protein [Cytophagales bacterium]